MMPRVVMLSGLGGGPRLWAKSARLLPDLEVVIPAVPWAVPGWRGNIEQARDFLVEHLSSCDVVVAHSFAATCTYNLLAAKSGPPMPTGVVLLSTFFRGSINVFDWQHFQRHVRAFPEVMASGIRAGVSRTTDGSRLARMAEVVCRGVGPLGWLRFYEEYGATPLGEPGRLAGRLTLIHGQDDSAASANDSVELHRLVPASNLHLLEGSGHFPMVDFPRIIARCVLERLDLGATRKTKKGILR